MAYCMKCFKDVPPEDLYTVDPGHIFEKFVCSKCLSDYYGKCGKCGNYFTTIKYFEGTDYCGECYASITAQCIYCGRTVGKYEITNIDPEHDILLCDRCYKEHVSICSACGKPTININKIDGRAFCDVCQKKLLSCFICGTYIVGENDTGICRWCANDDMYDALEYVSKEAVHAAYPDLKERIAALFGRALHNRDLAKGVNKTENEIVEYLGSRFDFDFVNLTYLDKSYPSRGPKPLSKLSSTSYVKEIGLQNEWLNDRVSLLMNKKRDRDGFVERETPHAFRNITTALRYRMYLLSKDEDLRAFLGEILGRYPIQGRDDLNFFFSIDPVDILSKSTGRDWEESSCEKYQTSNGNGGAYGKGIYSDIMHANIIVFIIDKNNHAHARIMLRWCKQDDRDEDWGIGIEPIWYSEFGRVEFKTMRNIVAPSPSIDGSHVKASWATNQIEKILEKLDLYGYSTCETPYVYKGFSDNERDGRTYIHYKR